MSPATDRPKRRGIMLAKPANDHLIRGLGDTFFVQPKLRGQRCRVAWVEDWPVLLTSYGNTFSFMGHIQEELLRLPRLPYDGELYNHELSQEEINSVVMREKNPHPNSELIQYHIFDIATQQRQAARFMCLDSLPWNTDNHSVVWLGFSLASPLDWPDKAATAIADGYEGLIFRAMDGLYVPLDPLSYAKRPSTVLKWKPTEHDDYVIVDLLPGTGWASGMLGSFLVEDAEGNRFAVGTGRELTKAKRLAHWNNRSALLGRRLRVKHEPIRTSGGLPVCTVAWEVLP